MEQPDDGRSSSLLRWHAVVRYRADAGPVDVEHDFDEFDELADLIERGPHWGTIDEIVVKYTGLEGVESLTLEQADKL